jgi:hypothetical protein
MNAPARVTGGNLTMANGAILRNNKTSSSGGGVYVGGGTFTKTGGIIYGRNSSYSNVSLTE